MSLLESKLKTTDAIYRRVIPAGDGWTREVRKGQVLRIVDLHGNQAAGSAVLQRG